MDPLMPEENENWYALLAAMVAAFLLAAAAGFLVEAMNETTDLANRPRAQESSFKPDEPTIAQAPWRIYTHPSAAFGKPTKKQRKAMRRVSPKLRQVVRDVYDAMIVSRSEFKTATRRWMSQLAAKELRSKPPIPPSLKRVKTTRRAATIGIDLRTRSRAAARIDIAFRADRGAKRLAFAHRGTLWLERGAKGGWKVIAFKIDQRRRA